MFMEIAEIVLGLRNAQFGGLQVQCSRFHGVTGLILVYRKIVRGHAIILSRSRWRRLREVRFQRGQGQGGMVGGRGWSDEDDFGRSRCNAAGHHAATQPKQSQCTGHETNDELPSHNNSSLPRSA